MPMGAGPVAAEAQGRWRAETLCEVGQFERVGGWQLGAVQTTPGRLVGSRLELVMDGLQWLDEDLYNVAVGLYGHAPADSLVFGVVLRGEVSLRVNGRTWRDSEVAAGSGQGAAEILVPPARIATLAVRRSLLARHLWLRDHVRLDDWASGVHPLLVRRPLLVQAMRGRLLQLAAELTAQGPGAVLSDAQSGALRHELLDVLADVVAGAVGAQQVPMRRSVQAEVVRQARRHVERHLAEQADAPLQVEDLCRTTRVSRRSLQRCFVDVVGVTPVQYLRLLRLGQARRQLLDGPPGQRVQDVLARLGIWHASRFAGEYSALFGELPSDTLRRRSGLGDH